MTGLYRRLLFSILLILIACGGAVVAITNPVFMDNRDSSSTISINQDRLLKDVKFLTELVPSRNSANLNSLDSAANYIKNEFILHSDRVELQKYRIDNKEYKNVIVSFGPENGERIIVGAHYDVCETQPGADDNASGVAGLLELARFLELNNEKLKCRIDLVAYTLEEPPFFRTELMGSAVHAKMLYDKHIKVKAMISLEMIGYFSDEAHSQKYPIGLLKLFYPTKGNYIAVVGKFGQGGLVRSFKRNMRRGSSIDVRSINAPAFIPGIDFSDHLNYWKYGYEAIMITDTSFYRNANYHERSDSLLTLDFVRMAEVVRGVCYTLLNFSE